MTTLSGEHPVFIEGAKYNTGEIRGERDAAVQAYLSPFNVPRRMFVRRLADKDRLSLAFEYDNEEPRDREEYVAGAWRAVLAKNSKKLLELYLDNARQALKESAVPSLDCSGIVGNLAGPQRFVLEMSTRLVNDVMRDNWTMLRNAVSR